MKHCPFCGSADIGLASAGRIYFAECRACNCMGPEGSKVEAAAKWEARYPSPPEAPTGGVDMGSAAPKTSGSET